MVIKDYETFNQEIEKLQQENLHLSKQLEEAVEQGKDSLHSLIQQTLIF